MHPTSLIPFAVEAGTQADTTATVISAIGGLVIAITGLITALWARRRNRDPDDETADDPYAAVRAEIKSLNTALETSEETIDDQRAQLRECRAERDRLKHENELLTARHALAIAQMGHLEQQLADAKHESRDGQ